MFNIILKFSLVNISFLILHYAFALHLIRYPFPIILLLVRPNISSKSFYFVSIPLPYIIRTVFLSN